VSTPLSPIIVSRLEKAAVDNGFDQEQPKEGSWLSFTSTQCPLRVWLYTIGDNEFLTAFSLQSVARTLEEYGTSISVPLPLGAHGGRSVKDIPAVHRVLRRAFQLSKTLPDELLHVFEKQTSMLPRSTEAERLVVQRVGQDVFRAGLLEYWEGRCAITGLAIAELLRASHIKPWAACVSDAQRLDVFNGLLLAPHLDALFDKGWITVADSGDVEVASTLSAADRELLCVDSPLRINFLCDGHRQYLAHHRTIVFKAEESGHE